LCVYPLTTSDYRPCAPRFLGSERSCNPDPSRSVRGAEDLFSPSPRENANQRISEISDSRLLSGKSANELAIPLFFLLFLFMIHKRNRIGVLNLPVILASVIVKAGRRLISQYEKLPAVVNISCPLFRRFHIAADKCAARAALFSKGILLINRHSLSLGGLSPERPPFFTPCIARGLLINSSRRLTTC